ncbi:hypothetical protein E4T44_11177 [Aureobasidium sp. EXF-8845]|nr:hypothetical protein E4T44_11177 [Aureobasidium sp. EXF-8845]
MLMSFTISNPTLDYLRSTTDHHVAFYTPVQLVMPIWLLPDSLSILQVRRAQLYPLVRIPYSHLVQRSRSLVNISMCQSYPERVEFRRNLKERLLHLEPGIGTRKDCIARSAALQLNSTRHANGLNEAVTCDLYSFRPKRQEECVCVPVYEDHVTLTSTVVQGVHRVVETTSVFYPPAQVVKSCLLAAATQGPPTVCIPLRSKCQESVEVLHRRSNLPGDFPYCATSTKNPWGPLPTGSDCERDDEEKSLCKNDKCMWGFVKPWESPTVKLVTTTGSDDVSLFGSVTESITITTPHWGFLAPVTKTGNSTATTTSTYNTSGFKSKKPKSSAHSAATPAPHRRIPNMVSLLLGVFVLNLAIHLINTLGAATINELLWVLYNKLPTPTARDAQNSARLKKEVVRLKREMTAVSAQDEFARWAKLRRTHDKAVADYEKSSTSRLHYELALEDGI